MSEESGTVEDEVFETDDSFMTRELNPRRDDSSVEYSEASLPSDASTLFEPTSPAYSIATGADADEESFFDDEDASTGSDFNPENASKAKLRKAYYSMFAKYNAVAVILEDYEARLNQQTTRLDITEGVLVSQTRDVYHLMHHELATLQETVRSNMDQINVMRSEIKQAVGSMKHSMLSLVWMHLRAFPNAYKGTDKAKSDAAK